MTWAYSGLQTTCTRDLRALNKSGLRLCTVGVQLWLSTQSSLSWCWGGHLLDQEEWSGNDGRDLHIGETEHFISVCVSEYLSVSPVRFVVIGAYWTSRGSTPGRGSSALCQQWCQNVEPPIGKEQDDLANSGWSAGCANKVHRPTGMTVWCSEGSVSCYWSLQWDYRVNIIA